MDNKDIMFLLWEYPDYVLKTLPDDDSVNANRYPINSIVYSIYEGVWYQCGAFTVSNDSTYSCWSPIFADNIPPQIIAAKKLLNF